MTFKGFEPITILIGRVLNSLLILLEGEKGNKALGKKYNQI